MDNLKIESAILLRGLPRHLKECAVNKITEITSRDKIFQVEYEDSVLKVYFKDYDSVLKTLDVQVLIIDEKEYIVYLLITPVTILGVNSLVSVTEMSELLIQSWGCEIFKVYEEEKPYGHEKNFVKTGNLRALLLGSDKGLVKQKYIKIPDSLLKFEVALYCRRCLQNDHLNYECQECDPKLKRDKESLKLIKKLVSSTVATSCSGISEKSGYSPLEKRNQHPPATVKITHIIKEEVIKKESCRSNDLPCFWTNAHNGQKWQDRSIMEENVEKTEENDELHLIKREEDNSREYCTGSKNSLEFPTERRNSKEWSATLMPINYDSNSVVHCTNMNKRSYSYDDNLPPSTSATEINNNFLNFHEVENRKRRKIKTSSTIINDSKSIDRLMEDQLYSFRGNPFTSASRTLNDDSVICNEVENIKRRNVETKLESVAYGSSSNEWTSEGKYPNTVINTPRRVSNQEREYLYPCDGSSSPSTSAKTALNKNLLYSCGVKTKDSRNMETKTDPVVGGSSSNEKNSKLKNRNIEKNTHCRNSEQGDWSYSSDGNSSPSTSATTSLNKNLLSSSKVEIKDNRKIKTKLEPVGYGSLSNELNCKLKYLNTEINIHGNSMQAQKELRLPSAFSTQTSHRYSNNSMNSASTSSGNKKNKPDGNIKGIFIHKTEDGQKTITDSFDERLADKKFVKFNQDSLSELKESITSKGMNNESDIKYDKIHLIESKKKHNKQHDLKFLSLIPDALKKIEKDLSSLCHKIFEPHEFAKNQTLNIDYCLKLLNDIVEFNLDRTLLLHQKKFLESLENNINIVKDIQQRSNSENSSSTFNVLTNGCNSNELQTSADLSGNPSSEIENKINEIRNLKGSVNVINVYCENNYIDNHINSKKLSKKKREIKPQTQSKKSKLDKPSLLRGQLETSDCEKCVSNNLNQSSNGERSNLSKIEDQRKQINNRKKSLENGLHRRSSLPANKNSSCKKLATKNYQRSLSQSLNIDDKSSMPSLASVKVLPSVVPPKSSSVKNSIEEINHRKNWSVKSIKLSLARSSIFDDSILTQPSTSVKDLSPVSALKSSSAKKSAKGKSPRNNAIKILSSEDAISTQESKSVSDFSSVPPPKIFPPKKSVKGKISHQTTTNERTERSIFRSVYPGDSNLTQPSTSAETSNGNEKIYIETKPNKTIYDVEGSDSLHTKKSCVRLISKNPKPSQNKKKKKKPCLISKKNTPGLWKSILKTENIMKEEDFSLFLYHVRNIKCPIKKVKIYALENSETTKDYFDRLVQKISEVLKIFDGNKMKRKRDNDGRRTLSSLLERMLKHSRDCQSCIRDIST